MQLLRNSTDGALWIGGTDGQYQMSGGSLTLPGSSAYLYLARDNGQALPGQVDPPGADGQRPAADRVGARAAADVQGVGIAAGPLDRNGAYQRDSI